MNRGNLVAAGLMSDILNIGNDTSRLIIEIKSDINAAVAVMQEQPDVKIEAVKENEIVVTGIDTDEKANMLVGQLMVRGVLVGGFHRDEHSLESIFMEITTGKAAQAGTVGQSGSAGQGQIIQPGVVNPYDQANQFGAGQFGQPNQFAQSGQFGQPNRFAQSGQFGQPNQFVQPGQFGAGQSAQPGQFNQQPDQSNQMGGYDNAGN